MKTWRFTALDSLFFRESRPFGTIGGSELSSVFPPSPSTMAGAIRSAIGDHQGVDWQEYHRSDGYPELKAQIGDSDSLGAMRLKGVFLSRKSSGKDAWERLYPVPAHLVATQEEGKIKDLHFLQLGKPLDCDLGRQICLAVAPVKGIKTLEDYWITQSGLLKVLSGEFPDKEELIHSNELLASEARLGIARNNRSRCAEKGKLYQTQHVRPKEGLAIEADVEGLATEYPESGIVRLGGEGRGAHFKVFDANNRSEKVKPSKFDAQGIQIMLMSSVHVPQQGRYTPLPNFTPSFKNGETVWMGKINGIDLTLHCAMIGKALREGGWDLQNKKPRPVRSFMPAGSVFYCSVDGDFKVAFEALKYAQLDGSPFDKALGRGLLTAGFWFRHDSI